MSFNIFAAGSPSFHYQKDGFVDGDTFEPMKLVNELMTMDLSVAGAVSTAEGHFTRKSHALWPDTMGFARYNFQPGDDPGAEFIKTIGPSLKSTDLNNRGVLAALSLVVARFSEKVGDNGTPMLNISLSH